MFWSKKKSSRKYVDLIWESSTKFPVWNPASDNIHVGDYGVLERETGQFIYHGNIYTDGIMSSLQKEHAPRGPNGGKGVISITSLNAKAIDVGSAIDVNAQVARLRFQCQWSFSKGTGAVLAVHNPQETTLPREFDVKAVTEHEKLRDTYLVTSVTTCPAYALYLASKNDSGISLQLIAEGPIGSSPVSAGPEIGFSWKSEHGGGFYRSGDGGKEPFTVLYELKKCKKKEPKPWHRDSPEPELSGLDALEGAVPPWDALDDEGEELEDDEDD